MEFGIFDHLDRAGTPLPDYYEDRLKTVEAFDRAGFYGYHIAEHHATPLGMAPSPNIFLSAVAQRTRRLRFGPMVYVVPLYHPLRLVAEICMLDQMSGGRLEISFGRGASPIELDYFGVDPAQAQDIYNEAVEVIIRGLTSKTLDFRGQHFSFDNVPMELAPLQKPHPPIWYGAHAPDSAARAARRRLNIVNLDPTDEVRLTVASYRKTWFETWRETQGAAALPKIGLGRFIVVADTDAQAMRLASRAYKPWYDSFTFLPRLHKRDQTHPRPSEFEPLMARGQGIAGSPATVRHHLQSQIEETGCNYVVGQFTFGDMTREEGLRSIGLFVDEVMPALREATSETRTPESVATGT
jgi:alkanesulfonate monooxygenase SsuD/methylene tetrahydromethanopterin reductase-like flavin-dependent oxidoreductase (luciferase family)